MGGLAIRTLIDPLENIKAGLRGHGRCVAVEEVEHGRRVSLGGEAVGEQLGVDVDAEDVGQEKEGGILLVRRIGRGDVDVGLAIGGLDDLALGLASSIKLSASRVVRTKTQRRRKHTSE